MPIPSTVTHWLLLFYFYCFVGWCFESTVVSVQQRRLVNRGFVRGPMLPLYGTGAVMMLAITMPFEAHPLALFFIGMIAATALEFVTGIGMEALFGVKYWDYSTHRFQYKGRICLQSSLCWGFLSVVLVQIIQPAVGRLAAAVPQTGQRAIVIVLTAVFVPDVIYAFRTAIDVRIVLEEMTRLHTEIDKLREELTARAGQARDKLDSAATGAHEALVSKEKRAAIQAKLDERLSAYEERIRKLHITRRLLLRAHPTARSRKFGEALRDLKERLGVKDD